MSSTVRFSTGLREALAGKAAVVQGFCGPLSIVFAATGRTLTRATGSFLDDGFRVGDRLFIKNTTSNNTANGTPKARISAVTALVITLDTSDSVVNETGANTVLASITGGSLNDVLRRCRVQIYSGAQPANADAAASGTLLLTYTDTGGTYDNTLNNGVALGTNGLEWEATAALGVLSKKSSQIWRGTVSQTDVMGWGRITAPGDDPTSASTSAKRIDFKVGTISPANMTGDINTIAAQVRDLVSASFTIPAQGT